MERNRMDETKIARINELAHKAKAEGLTEAEKKRAAAVKAGISCCRERKSEEPA